jgi:Domain of unknown function (DUF4262)
VKDDEGRAEIAQGIQAYGFLNLHDHYLGDRWVYHYTVGFWETLHHPEIIITMMPPDRAHQFAWLLYRKIRAGARYEAGRNYADIAQRRYLTRFGDVTPTWQTMLCYWHHAYYHEWPPLLQLIYPDSRGRFPHDPGCIRNQAAWPLLDKDAAA